MNHSPTAPQRTVVQTLILLIGGITVSTLVIVGIAFYQYTTISKIKQLQKQAHLIAEEIASVLVFPLYSLDDEAAVNSAKVYLSSGRLFGIRLISNASGVLVDDFRKQDSKIEPISRDLSLDGIQLGSMTILIADTELRSVQKATLIIISLLIFFILLVFTTFLHLIFSRTLITPLDKIITGIKRFGNREFDTKIENVGYSDLNQLVLGLNDMADRSGPYPSTTPL